jgi:hypothetical protein
MHAFEIVPAHARRGVADDRAEDRATRGGARQQATAHGSEREERHDQPGRQPDATAEHATDACRRLVLLDDFVLPRRSTTVASYPSIRSAFVWTSFTSW